MSNKEKVYTVEIQTSDIIDPDEFLENSFEWGDDVYNWDLSDSFEECLDFVPAKDHEFLEIESIKDQFENDVTRCYADAYVHSLEENLIKKMKAYVYDTIHDALDYSPKVTFTGSTNIVFSDTITLTFTRLDHAKFQKERDFYERINTPFDEEIIDRILYHKRRFSYDDLDVSYGWNRTEKLQEIFNDYNEVIGAIENLKKEKYAAIKKSIKGKIPLIYRQLRIDRIMQ